MFFLLKIIMHYIFTYCVCSGGHHGAWMEIRAELKEVGSHSLSCESDIKPVFFFLKIFLIEFIDYVSYVIQNEFFKKFS